MAQTKKRTKPVKRKKAVAKKTKAQKRKRSMPGMSREQHEKMTYDREPMMAASEQGSDLQARELQP